MKDIIFNKTHLSSIIQLLKLGILIGTIPIILYAVIYISHLNFSFMLCFTCVQLKKHPLYYYNIYTYNILHWVTIYTIPTSGCYNNRLN